MWTSQKGIKLDKWNKGKSTAWYSGANLIPANIPARNGFNWRYFAHAIHQAISPKAVAFDKHRKYGDNG